MEQYELFRDDLKNCLDTRFIF